LIRRRSLRPSEHSGQAIARTIRMRLLETQFMKPTATSLQRLRRRIACPRTARLEQTRIEFIGPGDRIYRPARATSPIHFSPRKQLPAAPELLQQSGVPRLSFSQASIKAPCLELAQLRDTLTPIKAPEGTGGYGCKKQPKRSNPRTLSQSIFHRVSQ
jgi:hypothetical protein